MTNVLLKTNKEPSFYVDSGGPVNKMVWCHKALDRLFWK